MNRPNARFWLSLTLALLMGALGLATGIAISPTIERTTYIDCRGDQFVSESMRIGPRP